MCIRSQADTDVDSFEEIEIFLEHVSGLSIDPGDSDEDEDIIIDKFQYIFAAANIFLFLMNN